jgi:hypothetical protein
MRTPPVVVCVLLIGTLVASTLFQACQSAYPEAIVWQELTPVEINPPGAKTDADREKAFRKALRHGKRSKTKFCVRKGTGRSCEDIPSPTLPIEAASKYRGERGSSQSEAGGGDELEAIHATQRVEFKSDDDKRAFLSELGLQ